MTITSSFEDIRDSEITELLDVHALGMGDLAELSDIIIKDIQYGIEHGLDIDDRKFVPNTEKWIKRKGHSTVYIGKTGSLFNSIKAVKTILPDGGEIVIRVDGLGVNWQEAPSHGMHWQRKFFGFGNRLKDKIGQWIQESYGIS